MEDKPGVVLECERAIDVVYASLIRVKSDKLAETYIKLNTAEVGSSSLKRLDSESNFRSMNTHNVLIVVVYTWVIRCVAHTLQESRFSGVRSTDYKDAKASIFLSELIGINVVAHCCCG